MRDAWLAQLNEHMTLDLRIMSSSSMLSVEITEKKKKKKENILKVK